MKCLDVTVKNMTPFIKEIMIYYENNTIKIL